MAKGRKNHSMASMIKNIVIIKLNPAYAPIVNPLIEIKACFYLKIKKHF